MDSSTTTFRRQGAREELPNNRSSCLTALDDDGDGAIEKMLQLGAAPAPPNTSAPDLQEIRSPLLLPLPPRPTGKREATKTLKIWRAPHQSSASEEAAMACALPSAPWLARGCQVARPILHRRWWPQTSALLRDALALSVHAGRPRKRAPCLLRVQGGPLRRRRRRQRQRQTQRQRRPVPRRRAPQVQARQVFRPSQIQARRVDRRRRRQLNPEPVRRGDHHLRHRDARGDHGAQARSSWPWGKGSTPWLDAPPSSEGPRTPVSTSAMETEQWATVDDKNALPFIHGPDLLLAISRATRAITSYKITVIAGSSLAIAEIPVSSDLLPGDEEVVTTHNFLSFGIHRGFCSVSCQSLDKSWDPPYLHAQIKVIAYGTEDFEVGECLCLQVSKQWKKLYEIHDSVRELDEPCVAGVFSLG